MYPYFENTLNQIFISHNKKTYNFPAHFHNYLEIAFCFSGRQYLKVGEKVFTLKKGDSIIIPPNTVHEYIAYDLSCDEPTEIIALICNTKLLSESITDIITKQVKNPFIDSKLVSEKAFLAFKNILSVKNDVELLGWTYILLSSLMDILEFIPSETNLELPSKIVAYINSNFKENLTINYIAKVFGYHPSYIAHLFCNQLKIPFRTYLGAVRSEYAASQINSTKKSLTEIAYDSGYNSLNTFCRCFKKHFNKTPSEYRKVYTKK